MSIEKVRQYFQPLGREQDILEFEYDLNGQALSYLYYGSGTFSR